MKKLKQFKWLIILVGVGYLLKQAYDFGNLRCSVPNRSAESNKSVIGFIEEVKNAPRWLTIAVGIMFALASIEAIFEIGIVPTTGQVKRFFK